MLQDFLEAPALDQSADSSLWKVAEEAGKA